MNQFTNQPKHIIMKAFPDPMRGAEQSFTNQTPYELESGMSLRDYLAAKAMQGELSSQGENVMWANEIDLAQRAYLVADAMLKAREINETL